MKCMMQVQLKHIAADLQHEGVKEGKNPKKIKKSKIILCVSR